MVTTLCRARRGGRSLALGPEPRHGQKAGPPGYVQPTGPASPPSTSRRCRRSSSTPRPYTAKAGIVQLNYVGRGRAHARVPQPDSTASRSAPSGPEDGQGRAQARQLQDLLHHPRARAAGHGGDGHRHPVTPAVDMISRRRGRAFVGVAALVMLLAGCGGGGGGSDAGYKQPKGPAQRHAEHRTRATSSSSPTTLKGPAGIDKIKLVGDGGLHTLVIDNGKVPGFQLDVAGSGTRPRRRSTSSPASTSSSATSPAHRQQGMEGTITVKWASRASRRGARRVPRSSVAGSGPTRSPLAHSSSGSPGPTDSISTCAPRTHRHRGLRTWRTAEHRRELARGTRRVTRRRPRTRRAGRRRRRVGRDHHPARVVPRVADRDEPGRPLPAVRRRWSRAPRAAGRTASVRSTASTYSVVPLAQLTVFAQRFASASNPVLATVVNQRSSRRRPRHGPGRPADLAPCSSTATAASGVVAVDPEVAGEVVARTGGHDREHALCIGGQRRRARSPCRRRRTRRRRAPCANAAQRRDTRVVGAEETWTSTSARTARARPDRGQELACPAPSGRRVHHGRPAHGIGTIQALDSGSLRLVAGDPATSIRDGCLATSRS